MERSVRVGLAAAAAVGALAGLGAATQAAAEKTSEFQRILEQQQQAERKAAADRQEQRDRARSLSAYAGTYGGWGLPRLRVLPQKVWTNARYQRAARKRRNVQRNRRAHRG